MPSFPELIGHRGASRERAENSLAAFIRAADLRADAVELDVHLTADGQLVVHHDPVVAEPPAAAIRSLTLAEVRRLRLRGEPVPTLGEVVEAVGGRLRIYCELKGAGTAEAAVRLLRPLGAGAGVHSFDHRMVADAYRLDPAVARGLLETSYHLDPVRALVEVEARDLWQAEALIDAPLVAQVHAAGRRVIAWTVNRPDRIRDLAALGVDGICTDDVAMARDALGERPAG